MERRLTAIQDELLTSHVRDVLGRVDYSYADSQRGVVVVGVWVPDTRAQRFAKERWGDLVELRSLLSVFGRRRGHPQVAHGHSPRIWRSSGAGSGYTWLDSAGAPVPCAGCTN